MVEVDIAMWDVSLGAGEPDKYHIAEFLFVTTLAVWRRETKIVEMEIMMWDVSPGAGEQDKNISKRHMPFNNVLVVLIHICLFI